MIFWGGGWGGTHSRVQKQAFRVGLSEISPAKFRTVPYEMLTFGGEGGGEPIPVFKNKHFVWDYPKFRPANFGQSHTKCLLLGGGGGGHGGPHGTPFPGSEPTLVCA